MKPEINRSTLITAYAIAICADLVQICLAPLFVEGIASPLDDSLDVIVCVILSAMIGFHFTFLPSFLVKLIPVGDVAPTWTLAVLIATRRLRTTAANASATEKPLPEVIIEEDKPPKMLPGKQD